MAHELLAAAHNRVLQLLSEAAGSHFNGLAQAARFHKALTTRQKRRIMNLDIAFNVTRHITRASLEDMLQDLSTSLVKEDPVAASPLAARLTAEAGGSYLRACQGESMQAVMDEVCASMSASLGQAVASVQPSLHRLSRNLEEMQERLLHLESRSPQVASPHTGSALEPLFEHSPERDFINTDAVDTASHGSDPDTDATMDVSEQCLDFFDQCLLQFKDLQTQLMQPAPLTFVVDLRARQVLLSLQTSLFRDDPQTLSKARQMLQDHIAAYGDKLCTAEKSSIDLMCEHQFV